MVKNICVICERQFELDQPYDVCSLECERERIQRDHDKVIRRKTYRPGGGTRVFAIRYQWPGLDPVWESVGALDGNDAGKYVAEEQSTVDGARPAIIKTVELFYDGDQYQYQPQKKTPDPSPCQVCGALNWPDVKICETCGF